MSSMTTIKEKTHMTLIVENIYSASHHQPILDQGTSRGKGLSNKEQKAVPGERKNNNYPPKARNITNQ